jgi:thymidylate kinase
MTTGRAQPTAIAIEGPCCAGKTTLADGLIPNASVPLAIIPDYADVVGGGDCMPDPNPKGLPGELKALEALLQIEEKRIAACRAQGEPANLVLIDRSVLTLSWHCAGLDLKNDHNPPFQHTVDWLLHTDSRPWWPDIVIYLDVSHTAQIRRNRGKFEPGSIFMDEAYNRGFRSGFERFARDRSVPVTRIDADLPPERVLDCALDFLREQKAL